MHTPGTRTYGAEIRKYREQRGLDVAALAKAVGCSSKHVDNVESGRKGASIDLLYRVAAALKVDPRALLAPAEPAAAQMAG